MTVSLVTGGCGFLGAAIARGLLSSDVGQELSRQEMLNLVFLPGLSTRSAITDMSGRGVGMDVVKMLGPKSATLDLEIGLEGIRQ